MYIPGEDLRASARQRRARVAAADGDVEAGLAVRFEADRAESWFGRGMALVPLLDRRSAACVRAMAGIYHRLLRRIEAEPGRVLRERVSLPAHEKAWVAVRALAGAPS